MQLYSPQLWRRAREVAHALVSRIGLPGGIVSIESFIGPYRSTSFGIHKDQFHVFTFPVVGEKTTRLWPYEALSKRLGLPDDADEALEVINTPFRTALPDARPPITLRARTGAMTYWPPQYWHIATGRGALSATVIVSVSATAPAIELVRKVAPKPKGRLEPVRPSASQAHVRALQAEARAQARALSSATVTEKLRDEVDKRVSATGFEPVVEPLASEPVSPTTVLEMDARFPIVTRRRGDTLDCFMNGHAISVTPARAMAKLIALLNRGGRFEAATLCRMTADWLLREGYEPDNEYVLEVLGAGVSFRTLTKTNVST